jgi:anti-sigma B factor antagonist
MIADSDPPEVPIMPEFKCIKLSKTKDISVVRLVDDRVMDADRIALMGQELLSLTESTDGNRVLLNLGNVRFLSSAAINKLIVLERRLGASGGDLKLSNLSPEVEEVFNITQLDSVFHICADEEQAMAAFS